MWYDSQDNDGYDFKQKPTRNEIIAAWLLLVVVLLLLLGASTH